MALRIVENLAEEGSLLNINQILSSEVLSHILSFIAEDPSQLYVPPVRLVCSLWRDLLAAPSKSATVSRTERFHPNHYTFLLARQGHLFLLCWARMEMGFTWDERTCSHAAYGGHLSILSWARENGCPWDEMTCAYAAKAGNLSALQWARENGCPWDEWTCAFAASGGHLSVLQWARENGCPWDHWVCYFAAQRRHLSVLRWARENGCPSDGVCLDEDHLSEL